MIRLSSIRTFWRVAAFALFLAGAAAAQSLDRAQMLEELRTNAGLTEEDFRKLEDGEIAVVPAIAA